FPDPVRFLLRILAAVLVPSVLPEFVSVHSVGKSKIDRFSPLALFLRNLLFPRDALGRKGVNVLPSFVRDLHLLIPRYHRRYPELNLALICLHEGPSLRSSYQRTNKRITRSLL